jgi:carboxyl-terminal processing protease
MKKPRLAERLLLIVLVTALLAGGIMVSRAQGDPERDEREERFWEFARVFAEVYHIVNEYYVEEPDPEIMFRAAINGMMGALDPHSQYMPADSFTQLEKDTGGEFSGIGIHLTRRDGLLTVIAPIPGGPAARLGVQPWDRIVEINGESTEGLTLTDAVRLMTGPVGTTVDVSFWRPGMTEPSTLTITREKIRIQNVYSTVLDDHVGLIRLAKFSDHVADDVLQALMEFEEQGVRGLIIDLRFNTGGLLDEAVKMSDLFLPADSVIVSTRGRNGKMQQEFRAERAAVVEYPIMILVNNASASASEILAAALRDHNRAVLIGPKGEKTFGKGSVQTVIAQNHTFEHDSEGNGLFGGYRLTTALYYTPSGVTIHEKGIQPDIEVELPAGQVRDLLAFGLLGQSDIRGPGEQTEEELPVTMPPDNGTPADDAGEATGGDDAAGAGDDESGEEGEEGWRYNVPVQVLDGVSDEKDFVDVQLEEARRLMRAYLILERAS